MLHFLFELLAKTNEGVQTNLDTVPMGRTQSASTTAVCAVWGCINGIRIAVPAQGHCTLGAQLSLVSPQVSLSLVEGHGHSLKGIHPKSRVNLPVWYCHFSWRAAWIEWRRQENSQIETQVRMKAQPAGTGALRLFALRWTVPGWTAFWGTAPWGAPRNNPLHRAAPLLLAQASPAHRTGDWISPKTSNYYQGKDSGEVWMKAALDLGSRPSFDLPAMKNLVQWYGSRDILTLPFDFYPWTLLLWSSPASSCPFFSSVLSFL